MTNDNEYRAGALACQVMATENSTFKIPRVAFDAATLKLSGAKSLISTLQIFISDTGDGEIPVSNHLLGEALNGIRLLLDDVSRDLDTVQGGA